MGLQLDLKICKLTQFKERRRLEDAMPIKIKLQIQLRLFEPVQVPGLDLAKNENSMNYYPYVKCKKVLQSHDVNLCLKMRLNCQSPFVYVKM